MNILFLLIPFKRKIEQSPPQAYPYILPTKQQQHSKRLATVYLHLNKKKNSPTFLKQHNFCKFDKKVLPLHPTIKIQYNYGKHSI